MIEKLSKIQFIKKDRIITVSKKWKGVRLTLLSELLSAKQELILT